MIRGFGKGVPWRERVRNSIPQPARRCLRIEFIHIAVRRVISRIGRWSLECLRRTTLDKSMPITPLSPTRDKRKEVQTGQFPTEKPHRS